jgi:cyclic pyranopterin phosphate synthase
VEEKRLPDGAASPFSHLDGSGRPRMVDVGDKDETKRRAVARGSVYMKRETLDLIRSGAAAKGDVLSAAQTAGIMAAKNTAQAIPMCHNIFLSGVEMRFALDDDRSAVRIEAEVRTVGKTGVEMEALHAVSVAALTVYDMCKAVDRGMRITDIRLHRKEGGESGLYEEA